MKQINKPIQFKLKDPKSWFRNLLNQMEQKPTTKYLKLKQFYIDGEIYMEYDPFNYIIWFNYSKIYSILEDEFILNVLEIEDLVKNEFIKHTNLPVYIAKPTSLLNTNHHKLKTIKNKSSWVKFKMILKKNSKILKQ